MGHDDHDGPNTDDQALVDEIVDALQHAFGSIDVRGLKDAVKKGLDDAVQAVDFGDDDDADGPADNVVPLEPRRPEDPDDPALSERVSVKVLRGGLGQGRLRVDEGWQTVWWGPAPRDYRLSLDRGQLEVVVDDQTVAQLLPGQTADVSGSAIRVRGAGRGHYTRLS